MFRARSEQLFHRSTRSTELETFGGSGKRTWTYSPRFPSLSKGISVTRRALTLDNACFCSIQRGLVSSSAQLPACCQPETSSTVWPSGCSSARSTSVTRLLRCTLPNRELSLFTDLLASHRPCTDPPTPPSPTGTAATSYWDTFPCWQIKNTPSSHR